MKKDLWKDQFERIQRYAVRIRRYISFVPYDRPADFFVDDVHAFFVEVHSFKDWLKNDPSYTDYDGSEIESFITSKFELSLCADLANGKKHLQCTTRKGTSITGYHLRYIIEAILTPDGDCERQIAVSSRRKAPSKVSGEGGDFTIIPSTKDLDKTKADWLKNGFAQEDIEFIMYVDIEHEGKGLDYDDGIADFADDVIDLWYEFIKDRRPGFNRSPQPEF